MRLHGSKGDYSIAWIRTALTRDGDADLDVEGGGVGYIAFRADNLIAASAVLAADPGLVPIEDDAGWVAPFLTNGGTLRSQDDVRGAFFTRLRERSNKAWTYILGQAPKGELNATLFKAGVTVVGRDRFFAIRKRASGVFSAALTHFGPEGCVPLPLWKGGNQVDAPAVQDGFLRMDPKEEVEVESWADLDSVVLTCFKTEDPRVLLVLIEDPRRKGRLAERWRAIWDPAWLTSVGLAPMDWKRDIFYQAVAWGRGADNGTP